MLVSHRKRNVTAKTTWFLPAGKGGHAATKNIAGRVLQRGQDTLHGRSMSSVSSEDLTELQEHPVTSDSSEDHIELQGHPVTSVSSEDHTELQGHPVTSVSSEDHTELQGHPVTSVSSEDHTELQRHHVTSISSEDHTELQGQPMASTKERAFLYEQPLMSDFLKTKFKFQVLAFHPR